MAFHPLTVAAVEPVCDDAAAVTFDVPPGLRDAYAFAPGQSLTLRRTVDGVEQRRSYSICAPAGERPRVGVREIPDGLFSRWLVRDVRPGDRIEVQTPTGRFQADAAAGGRHLGCRHPAVDGRRARRPLGRGLSTPRAPQGLSPSS